MTDHIHCIQEGNLSRAWAHLLLRVMQGANTPVYLSLTDFAPDGLPNEDTRIRESLESTLAEFRAAGKIANAHKKFKSLDDNAAMLFPQTAWRTAGENDREALYKRHEVMERRIHALGGSPYGTYFGRLTRFEGQKNGRPFVINQVEHMIGLLRRGRTLSRRPRHSALQMSVLDPAKDHTGQPVRGFPCLQQISLSVDDQGLSILALYPTQFIFDRAYGNYLGLCHLGRFIATQAGMRLARMSCLVNEPHLGSAPKGSLRSLETTLSQALKEAS